VIVGRPGESLTEGLIVLIHDQGMSLGSAAVNAEIDH
jgi:hypothetical protein